MGLRRWSPDVLLLLAALVIELGVELHAVVMDRTVAVLVIRVPVIIAVVLLSRGRPVAGLVMAGLDAALQPATFGISGALPVAAFAVTRHKGRWAVRLPALAVTYAIVLVGLIRHWHPHAAVIIALSFVLWPATIGAYQAARTQVFSTLQQLEATRHLLANQAVLQERARIASEMHDVVGHRVSLLALHAGAVEMAARDPSTVARLAGQMQATSRQALQELRDVVGLLRTGEPADAPRVPQPTLADLDDLVEQSRQAGIDVTLEPSGPVRPLVTTVERTAYRVVQEALTNAGRHAPGAPVSVQLVYRPTELEVRIVNRQTDRTPLSVSGPGHGLAGLRERVQAIGGRMSARPRADGGFGVEAVLPA